MLQKRHILIVGDDVSSRHNIALLLNFIGESTLECSSSDWELGLLDKNAERNVGIVFLYSDCHNIDLAEWVFAIKSRYKIVPVVLIGDTSVNTLNDKPELKFYCIARLNNKPNYNSVNDAIHRAQRFRECIKPSRTEKNRRPVNLFRSLVGSSRVIQDVRSTIEDIAHKEMEPVLISGAAGTGKEVVARNLHYNSSRKGRAFVSINCTGIQAGNFEGIFFGKENSRSDDKDDKTIGCFEEADRGTLFISDIDKLPSFMQLKILLTIQRKKFERVGGNTSVFVDVRIIVATHKNLKKMTEVGLFREDLYCRLSRFLIKMPTLNTRTEDIPLLIHELVARLDSDNQGAIRFDSAAIMSLCQHSWPGNVRELANLIEQMVLVKPVGAIGIENLPPKYRYVDINNNTCANASSDISIDATKVFLPDSGIDLKAYIADIEQNLIKQALRSADGVIAKAAEQLGMRRTTLVEKMRKYGLSRR